MDLKSFHAVFLNKLGTKLTVSAEKALFTQSNKKIFSFILLAQEVSQNCKVADNFRS